jgi:hypothetical protein
MFTFWAKQLGSVLGRGQRYQIYTEVTYLDCGKFQCLANPKVLRNSLLMRNRGYIEFEMLEKQCFSYLRKIMTAINYFLPTYCT